MSRSKQGKEPIMRSEKDSPRESGEEKSDDDQDVVEESHPIDENRRQSRRFEEDQEDNDDIIIQNVIPPPERFDEVYGQLKRPPLVPVFYKPTKISKKSLQDPEESHNEPEDNDDPYDPESPPFEMDEILAPTKEKKAKQTAEASTASGQASQQSVKSNNISSILTTEAPPTGLLGIPPSMSIPVINKEKNLMDALGKATSRSTSSITLPTKMTEKLQGESHSCQIGEILQTLRSLSKDMCQVTSTNAACHQSNNVLTQQINRMEKEMDEFRTQMNHLAGAYNQTTIGLWYRLGQYSKALNTTTDTLDSFNDSSELMKSMLHDLMQALQGRFEITSPAAASSMPLTPIFSQQKIPVKRLFSAEHDNSNSAAQKESLPNNKKSCIFCTMENHNSIECRFVSDPIDRRTAALDQKRCFQCLEVGVGSQHGGQCPQKEVLCNRCGWAHWQEDKQNQREHHPALCDQPRFPNGSAENGQAGRGQPSNKRHKKLESHPTEESSFAGYGYTSQQQSSQLVSQSQRGTGPPRGQNIGHRGSRGTRGGHRGNYRGFNNPNY